MIAQLRLTDSLRLGQSPLAFQALPSQRQTIASWWGYQVHNSGQGHGRLERRTLESITALKGYLDWPAVAQVLRRTCWTRHRITGHIAQEIHLGLTNLPRDLVSIAQVEQFCRWHWTIENRLHDVRDVTLGEDASQLRTSNAPPGSRCLSQCSPFSASYKGWSRILDALRFSLTMCNFPCNSSVLSHLEITLYTMF